MPDDAKRAEDGEPTGPGASVSKLNADRRTSPVTQSDEPARSDRASVRPSIVQLPEVMSAQSRGSRPEPDEQGSEEARAAVREARRQRSRETSGRKPREQDFRLPPEEEEDAPPTSGGDELEIRADAAPHVPRQRSVGPRDIEAVKVNFPPLPMPTRRGYGGTFLSFLLLVALPVCLAVVYYFFIASDQYVSEFKFAVRDAKSASSGAATGMTDILSFASPGANSLESYMVTEYIKSEPAVKELQARIDLRALYSRPEIDWLGRFHEDRPMESFTSYWNRKVSAQFDQITGIGTARVRAYRPEDAYLIATTLVSMSEELINNMATRPQRDAIRAAEADLKKVEDRLKEVGARLAHFRNTEQVIEPGSNVVTSNVQLAQTLRAELAKLRTDLSALTRQNLDPKAPMVLALQSRIRATREQLAAIEGEVAQSREGANPLSKIMSDYEQLDLERQYAQESVKMALRTLDDARSRAVFQHMYVTPFISPNLPQRSTYPQRLTSVAIVALGALLLWTAGLLFFRSVREHIA
jgi:capsular polysaccharide transport system permease protein